MTKLRLRIRTHASQVCLSVCLAMPKSAAAAVSFSSDRSWWTDRSAMDRLRNIDLNSFPFKLRFSPTNKVYKEILSISSEIHASFLKLNREIHDKNEIKNIISKSIPLQKHCWLTYHF